MSISPDRYVAVSAAGTPADPQAQVDLEAAAQAGAVAGDIAGRAAGQESGALAGAEAGTAAATTVATEQGAAAGAAAAIQAITPLLTEAEQAAADAEAQATAAAVSANAADADRIAAELAADRAEAATASSAPWPLAAATTVPTGLVSVTITNAGTGYTNGLNYVGTVTGGGSTIAGRFLFDVVGGSITNIHGIEGGFGYTAAPTVGFGAAGAGTGAAATAAIGALVPSGERYWVVQSDNATLRLYVNSAGTATAVSPAVYRPFPALVPTTTGGTVNAYTGVIATGFAVVNGGVGQVFTGTMLANNAAAGLTMAIPGVFGGVATQVLLPTGEPIPERFLKTPVSGSGFPFGVTPVGTRYIMVWPSFTPIAETTQTTVVSQTANVGVLKIAYPGTRTTPTMYDQPFSFVATEDKAFGVPLISLQYNDGSALLPSLALFDRLGGNTLAAAGLWKKGERVTVQRVAAAPFSGNLQLVTEPNTALITAAQLDFAQANSLPTTAKPVVMWKSTETSWLAYLRAFQYDAGYEDQLNKSNYQAVEIYNAAPAMSLAVLKSAYAWVWRSMWFQKNGATLEYGNFVSRETSPSIFNGEQPSTPNWVLRLGLAGDPSSGYGICGPWHGLLEMVTSSVKVAGDATEYVAAGVGTELRGASITFDTWYNAYRAQPTNDADKPNKWVGVIRDRYVMDANGLNAYPEFYTGQRLGYSNGSVAVTGGSVVGGVPVPGQTIEGATSGATAQVVFVPTTGQTGSIGAGTLAGTFFISDIVLGGGGDNFTPGETLLVSGNPVATVASAPSAEVGCDDSFGALGVATNVNRAKLNGQPEITVGLENGATLPLPNGTWGPAGGHTLGVRNTIEPDAWFETILLNGASPMTPPGNFSECLANTVSFEDRVGGCEKSIFAFRSQTSSANPGRSWQGVHTTANRWRMRIGGPV